MPPLNRSIELVERTCGPVRAEQFRIRESALRPLAPGTALLENVYLLIEQDVVRLLTRGWQLHMPMPGGAAIGRVIASRTAALPVGTLVRHVTGWTTHTLVWAGQPGLRVVEATAGLPVTVHLSALGAAGATAWRGVCDVLRLRPGEVLYVACGTDVTGSLVGQFARLRGAGRLLAGVRGAEAARVATQVLGFDEAYDILESAALGRLAGPSAGRVDAAWVDLDDAHVAVVADSLRPHGGRIAHTTQRVRPVGAVMGPRPVTREIVAGGARVVVHTYFSENHGSPRRALEAQVLRHLAAGRITVNETIVDGLDHVVGAFLATLRGELTGAVIARLADG
ncbi:hypothetical protein AB0E83_26800 [Streptomyces sp. NPDC035033]|uniref:hypothetical protein n=1 Tax=Streptomyces sp. NPDC035033 TaxID=3155368 RepID=UPI0033F499AB